ncbi:MAG: hypothetical protein ACP5RH_00215 [Leptodesmis sp.]|uniref:hypothetical protein n=1 Tax=Leptodesmis sp. TaxID=3100501 RepID=UPI003D141C8D
MNKPTILQIGGKSGDRFNIFELLTEIRGLLKAIQAMQPQDNLKTAINSLDKVAHPNPPSKSPDKDQIEYEKLTQALQAEKRDISKGTTLNQ